MNSVIPHIAPLLRVNSFVNSGMGNINPWGKMSCVKSDKKH